MGFVKIGQTKNEEDQTAGQAKPPLFFPGPQGRHPENQGYADPEKSFDNIADPFNFHGDYCIDPNSFGNFNTW